MKKSICLIQIALITLCLFVNADAFNNKRKGFILGGGLGLGLTSLQQTVTIDWLDEATESERENKFGFMTNFKIGYAPSDIFEIYFAWKDSWFGSKIYRLLGDSMGEDVTMASGLWGLGVTYYFKPEAPSYFITGGFGLSTLSLPFESHSDTKEGGGLFAGAGYEFRPHFNVELDLIWGRPEDFKLFGIQSHTSVLSVALTVNALAY
jgi:hypothetical protein